jgi:hypothetical protein
MQKRFDDILQKRMDRKDFLKHVGIGVAVMTGAAGLIKMLNPQAEAGTQQANSGSESRQSLGYGASTYGGRPVASQNS